AHARQLFRGRAFSLHHGGRRVHVVLRRSAFLVAENHWAHVPGGVGALFGHPDIHRLQPHLLSAVHPGLPRYAAPLSDLSTRISGMERLVVGRSVAAGLRLHPAAHLPAVVASLRRARAGQSLGRQGSGVGNGVAAAVGKFSCHAAGVRGSVCLRTLGVPPWLTPSRPTLRNSTTPSSSARPRTWGFGSFWPPRSCSSACCLPRTRSPACAFRRHLPPPAASPTCRWRAPI